MPSPFPGMDPWLERPALWPAVHYKLIALLETVLNESLPDNYLASPDTRVYVDPEANRRPDAGVFRSAAPPVGPVGTTVTAVAGAGLLAVEAVATSDPVEEGYLEILSADDERLVTAIEILSPANKAAGEGRKAYRSKRDEFWAGGVNVVEIDLLRGGLPTTAASPSRLRAVAGPCEYHVCVTVAGGGPQVFVKPIRLTEPLPAIPIPLDPGVPIVMVALQPLLDATYDTGRFAKRARYAQPPDPPLTPDQQAWAAAILRDKRLLPEGA